MLVELYDFEPGYWWDLLDNILLKHHTPPGWCYHRILNEWAVTSSILAGSGCGLFVPLCPFGAPRFFGFFGFCFFLNLCAEEGVCGFSYLVSFAFRSSITLACSAISSSSLAILVSYPCFRCAFSSWSSMMISLSFLLICHPRGCYVLIVEVFFGWWDAMWVLKSERIKMRYFSHHSSREYRLGKDKRGGAVNKYEKLMCWMRTLRWVMSLSENTSGLLSAWKSKR